MYTGLRACIKIKPEFRQDIKKLHDDNGWENTNIPNIDKWMNFDRRGFIPFGALTCMPDDFGDPFEDRRDEYGSVSGGTKFDGEWWTFSCSLKNYEGEIQFFIENVLKHIVEEVDYCESLYEDYPYDDNGIDAWRNYTQDYTKVLTNDCY